MLFEQLDTQAARTRDNGCALALNVARKKLFQEILTSIKKQACEKLQGKIKTTSINQSELAQRVNKQIKPTSFRLISG